MLIPTIHGSRADAITQGILLGCFLTFVVFWAVAARWSKRTVERGRWSWWLIAMLFGVAAFEIGGHGGRLSRLAMEPLWSRGVPIDVAAIALAITGLVLMLWARVTLGSNWSGMVVFKENHELVTGGPYAIVRHPIYTGLLTMLLGNVLFFGVAGGRVWLVIAFVVFWLKSRDEERLMTRHFPDEYAAYRARVKALVPFVF